MKTLRRNQQRRRRSGFTLLELLIVLAIIVALAAMVAPNLIGNQQTANIRNTRAQIRIIEDAVKRRAVNNNGVFPAGGPEIIDELAQPYTDNMNQEYPPELEEIPRDAWNNKFQYAFDESSGDIKPRIWSLGPNGQDEGGQGDDVSNLRRDQDS